MATMIYSYPLHEDRELPASVRSPISFGANQTVSITQLVAPLKLR
jgi:hypothetical protein